MIGASCPATRNRLKANKEQQRLTTGSHNSKCSDRATVATDASTVEVSPVRQWGPELDCRMVVVVVLTFG